MRFNLWLGAANMFHQIRDLIKQDNRVAIPVMPEANANRDFVINSVREVPDIEKIYEWMYYKGYEEKQEANLGFFRLKDSDKLDIVIKSLPAGSRVWFWRMPDVDEAIRDYSEYVLESLGDPSFSQRPDVSAIKERILTPETFIKKAFYRTDKLADYYGADPWRPLNLSEYWEDGKDKPTHLEVRKFLI